MRYLIKLNTAEIGQLGELLSFNPVEVIQYRSTSHIIMCTNGKFVYDYKELFTFIDLVKYFEKSGVTILPQYCTCDRLKYIQYQRMIL